ncbi:MAG: hypothetical protein DRP55_01535 [Spirochaetes bacterium]|nr:MAG: hypothetical protein DRP55_01535 [Spirochaetota bacterium]
MKNRLLLLLVILTLAFVFASPTFAGGKWPAKQITCIVPYKAGGSADRLARGIAPFLKKELGVPFIIENRPGASGQIGATVFLSRPADGYTILLGVQPYLSNTIINQGAKYSLDDFAVVNVENFGAVSITVHADSPYKTFDQLIKAVKANPNKVKWGVVRGGGIHLFTLLLLEKLNLKPRIILYHSGAPVRTALLGKQIDVSSNGAVADATMKPKVRSLALSTSNKLGVWPNSPFINDALKPYGVKLPEVGDMRFFAFKKEFKEKYPDRWNKFLKAYKNVLNSQGYKEYTKKIGTAPETSYFGPEKSSKLVLSMHQLMLKYKDKFKKKKK